MTIINVYGLTAERATQRSEELQDLHNDLTTLNNNLKKLSTSMILIVGNLNEKVGKENDFEICIGKLTLSYRNDNTNKATEQHGQTQLSTETPNIQLN